MTGWLRLSLTGVHAVEVVLASEANVLFVGKQCPPESLGIKLKSTLVVSPGLFDIRRATFGAFDDLF